MSIFTREGERLLLRSLTFDSTSAALDSRSPISMGIGVAIEYFEKVRRVRIVNALFTASLNTIAKSAA
ncbi:MAG: hypothetical protein M3Y22_12965, partial [Pseudomonadota bacterium]|jgi:hypothetical protein|nr:hypothetical protein [Pseudomonadota bacterium]